MPQYFTLLAAAGGFRTARSAGALNGAITRSLGDTQEVVKMDRDFEVAIDVAVGIKIDPRKACLFDPASCERVRA